MFLLDAVSVISSTDYSINAEILNGLITGGFTLLGVVVGSFLSYKIVKKQESLRLLAEFYAEVFSAYTVASPFNDNSKNMLLHAAAEKAKLLCSDESTKILTDLQMEITAGYTSIFTCGSLLSKLRESAKRDLKRL